MITVRPAGARGHADHGWLDSRHTFSFADYYDERHMGFRALRVINEDRVQPGQGFGTHSHRDMEIISYVLAGALQHEDSLGNGSVIRPHEVQRMTAGRGVAHSEFNPSRDEPVHFLQIWILPRRRDLDPSYEQRAFPVEEQRNRLRVLAAEDGRDDAVTVHQDVELYGTVLDAGAEVRHTLRPGRHAWVQVVGGDLRANGERLHPGDGAALSDEPALDLVAVTAAAALVFDLA